MQQLRPEFIELVDVQQARVDELIDHFDIFPGVAVRASQFIHFTSR